MNLARSMTVSLLLLCCSVGKAAPPQSLNSTLEPHLALHGLPGLAAAVVREGKIVAAGAVGTRQAGARIPVTLDDRFHLGSDTKAMTSLLAAMLVEEQKLHWDTTVGETFPEFSDRMNAGLKGVTLLQLLSHTSGIPSDNDALDELLAKAMLQDGNLDEMRRWLVRQLSMEALSSPPGARFAYSNLGYTLAGAMLEKVSGKTWDELITERIFAPLELRSAGLGCQASLGRIDAPLGHAEVNGKIESFLGGPNCDNPPIIGPAGIVHMSVLDFARWAGWNAGEGKRGPRLVRPETLKKLHTVVIRMPAKKDAAPGTPSSGGYALGWGEVRVDWAPKPLIHHGGSNTRNLAHIWLDTQRDVAMVIMTNISQAKTGDGLLQLAGELYRKFALTNGTR